MGGRVMGFLDPGHPAGSSIDRHLVLGGDEWLLSALRGHLPVGIVIGIGAIPSTDRRREMYDRLVELGITLPPLVHPSALVGPDASFGAACQILAGAIVNPGAHIGHNVVVNTGAIVEHDSRIGPSTFLGPGAVTCGGAVLGEGAFLGAGSIVLPGVAVGDFAVVGAGSVVTGSVSSGQTVVGVPARPLAPESRKNRRRVGTENE